MVRSGAEDLATHAVLGAHLVLSWFPNRHNKENQFDAETFPRISEGLW